MTLTKVKLYGHLGRKYGRVHYFQVASAVEAIKALQANFPGFCNHLVVHSLPGYHVVLGTEALNEIEVALPMASGRTIKIVPAVTGGKSPWVTIIIGVALVALAVASGGSSIPATAAWMGVSAGTATMIVGAAFGMGVSLVMGGVSQLLAGQPQLQGPSSAAENQPSYTYDGAVNTTSQGYPVPVCYGMMEVGSAVASMGVYAEAYQGDTGEPTTGFRITAPLGSIYHYLAVTDPPTMNISEPITFGSAIGTPTATITSQTPASTFTLTGLPGSQVLVATALPIGVYTVTLHGADDSQVTDKIINITIADRESGGGDDPHIRTMD